MQASILSPEVEETITMSTALIGYTGFVGKNLASQFEFDELYNSRNIDDIRGRSFDLLVCAGVSAKKWIANQDPESDWSVIQKLLNPLQECKCKSVVLISTIDVYPSLSGVDEDFDCHGKENHIYGRNRLRVEDFFSEKFKDCTIVRLPALFGRGLKKNVIFDLLHDNMLDNINPQNKFQWYCTDWIWRDIETIRRAGLPLVMMATEPVVTSDILEFFPGKKIGRNMGPLAKYNVRTKYSDLFECKSGYTHSKGSVLQAMAEYIENERAAMAEN